MMLKKFINNSKYIFASKNSYGYIGWMNQANLGDEALFQAFQKIFPNINFLSYKENHYLKKAEKIRGHKLYRGIFLGGGTLINSAYLEILTSAAKLYSPTFIFGAGVRNPEFWNQFENSSQILPEWKTFLDQNPTPIGVRGPLSKNLISDLTFNTVEVIGDPVLIFADEQITPKPRTKTLGLNIGFTNQKLWGDETKWLQFIETAIQKLRAEGWTIHLFCIYAKDFDTTKSIAAKTKIPNNQIHCIYEDTLLAIRKLRECDIFIGEKLHSTIISHCALTPSIMYEYQPKCYDYMSSVNQENFCLRTDNHNFDDLYDRIQFLYQNQESHQKELLKQINIYKERLEDYASKILSITNLKS